MFKKLLIKDWTNVVCDPQFLILKAFMKGLQEGLEKVKNRDAISVCRNYS